MKIFNGGTIGSTKNPLSLIEMADKADTGQCVQLGRRYNIQQEMECGGRSATST